MLERCQLERRMRARISARVAHLEVRGAEDEIRVARHGSWCRAEGNAGVAATRADVTGSLG